MSTDDEGLTNANASYKRHLCQIRVLHVNMCCRVVDIFKHAHISYSRFLYLWDCKNECLVTCSMGLFGILDSHKCFQLLKTGMDQQGHDVVSIIFSILFEIGFVVNLIG